ncbi:MAG: AAA family ATPase [Fimbriiglobus sp.]
MIRKVRITSFKSLEDVELELGLLNVFVGANGSGKSNLLEAIGILSAAADGRVNDQMLLMRGVRPGLPGLYKSSFKATKTKPTSIGFEATNDDCHYKVVLNNPTEAPEPSWKYETEILTQGKKKLVSPKTGKHRNLEHGMAALRMAEYDPESPAAEFLKRLQQYVIYTPTTPILRGLIPDNQPREPLGLSGGNLAICMHMMRIHQNYVSKNDKEDIFSDSINLLNWVSSISFSLEYRHPFSRNSKLPITPVFKDRFMHDSFLAAFEASEGALFVLFMNVIASFPGIPNLCAVDNADHGLNPVLAKNLFHQFALWLQANRVKRQVLLTTHNPAVLDGLPLQDDEIRLFTVDRDVHGKTVVRRVVINEAILKLAEKGWTLSRMWMNGHLGGVPNV